VLNNYVWFIMFGIYLVIVTKKGKIFVFGA